MLLKAVLIVVPRDFIAATAPRPTRAATNAYSIRSWPDSSFIRFEISCFMVFSLYGVAGFGALELPRPLVETKIRAGDPVLQRLLGGTGLIFRAIGSCCSSNFQRHYPTHTMSLLKPRKTSNMATLSAKIGKETPTKGLARSHSPNGSCRHTL